MSGFKNRSLPAKGREFQEESSSSGDDTSETSVDSSDSEDESSGESDKDEISTRMSTRTSAPSTDNETQRGRVTRQKTKEQQPTKRLLRSRNKSPVPGSRTRQSQSIPCPNCKKEFSNQSSVNRHSRWCKPKTPKSSPKKKAEGSKSAQKDVSNSKIEQEQIHQATSVVTSPDKPRGRGRPRKTITAPDTVIRLEPSEPVLQHGMIEDFIQSRSPESSPGIPDTSSESEYEQREFAANAHLTNRSSNVSIDVVNPDIPGESHYPIGNVSEGPVMCSKCKMTYRTAQGFQNHLPSCLAYSSSSDEDEEVDVQTVSDGPNLLGSRPQHPPVQLSIEETRIAPPLSVISNHTEENSTSDDCSSSSEDTKPLGSCFEKCKSSEKSKVDDEQFQQESLQSNDDKELVAEPSENNYTSVGAKDTTTSEGDIVHNHLESNTTEQEIPPVNSPKQEIHATLAREHLELSVTQPKKQHGQIVNQQQMSSVTILPVGQIGGHEQRPHTHMHFVHETQRVPSPPIIRLSSHPENVHTTHFPSHQNHSIQRIPTGTPPHETFNLIQQAPPPHQSNSPRSSNSIPQQLIHNVHQNTPTYTQAQMLPGASLNSLLQIQQQMATSSAYPMTSSQQQHAMQTNANNFPPPGPPFSQPSQNQFQVQNGFPHAQNPSIILPHQQPQPNADVCFNNNPSQQQQHHPSIQMIRNNDQQRMTVMPQVPTHFPQFTQQPIPMPPAPHSNQFQMQQQGQEQIQIPNSMVAHPQQAPNSGNTGISPYGALTLQNIQQMIQHPHQMGLQASQLPNQQQQHILQGSPLDSQFRPHPSASSVPSQNAVVDQHNVIHQGTHRGLAGDQASMTGNLGPHNFSSNQFTAAGQQQIQYPFFQNLQQSQPQKLPEPPQQQSQSMQPILESQHSALSSNGLNGNPPPHNMHPNLVSYIQQQQQAQQQQIINPYFQPPTTVAQHHPGTHSIFQNAVPQNHEFNPSFQLQPGNQINSPMQNGNVVGHGVNQGFQQSQSQQIQQQFFPGQIMPGGNVQQQQQHMAQNLHLQEQQRIGMQGNPQNAHGLMHRNGSMISQWPKTNMPTAAQVQPTQQLISQHSATLNPSAEVAPQHSVENQSTQQPTVAAQPQMPPMIQQLAQLPDGSTIAILLTPTHQPHQSNPGNTSQNGIVTNNSNISSHFQGTSGSAVLNLLPNLQGIQCPQQQISPPQNVHCTLTSPGLDGSTSGQATPSRTSAPCPCPACKEKLMGNGGEKCKYKKVLPYPADHNIKQSPSSRPIMIRPGKPQKATIRVQKGVTFIQNGLQQQLFLPMQQQDGVCATQLRLIPEVTKSTPPGPVGNLGVAVLAGGESSITQGRNVASNPNIAVVRPMENPLQKLSDQISQIESTFLSTNQPPHQQQQQSPLAIRGPHLTLVTASPPPQPQNTIPMPSRSPQVRLTGTTEFLVARRPALELAQTVDAISGKPSISPPQPRLALLDQASVAATVVQAETLPSPSKTVPVRSGPVAAGIKRKVATDTPPADNKSIKVTLRRKEGGDSYSINRISGTASGNGTMKSLKIKGQIKSGEQAGTSTDVVVVPVTHTVPIPDPDGDETQSNKTIAEFPSASDEATEPSVKLTHRAVIVYEVQSNDSVLFRSSDVRAVWGYIFETVQGSRLHHNLPPLSYPATNISLPPNKQEADANFNKLGLTHRAVQFLLEQLPGMKALSSNLKSEKPQAPTIVKSTTDDEGDTLSENKSGCARTERFTGRKSFDMFGWLASVHRTTSEALDIPMETSKNMAAPLGMRFRKLKERADRSLVVRCSDIHGRGLFTRRDIEKSEMIIEYAGEVIRPLVCDIREKYYESKSVGCYMFRINDQVIDATMKGNAARFINHSCEPNCEAKAVKISGKDHIIIFALRRICLEEELTYDYKFDKEEEKIPCSCRSKRCRKYLN